jgi:hypothetical protein
MTNALSWLDLAKADLISSKPERTTSTLSKERFCTLFCACPLPFQSGAVLWY